MKIVLSTFRSLFAIFALLLVSWLFTGCSKDSATNPANTDLPTANKDISETVAGSIAMDNGGIVDQIADLAAIATESDSFAVAKLWAGSAGAPTYDSITGTWRLQFTRERGEPGGSFHAIFTRTYTYQYRNRNGEPQKQWLVDSDTAYSIQFGILEGNGECRTLRLCQQLNNMNGNWLATGVNTDTLIISGTYECNGLDTLRSFQTVRAMQYQLSLMFTNMRCLRGKSVDFTGRVAGNMSGTFLANVAFMSGYSYGETNIFRNMNISMAEGEASITIGSERFMGDLATGELSGDN
jgi:hypothetical protein